MHFKLLIPTLVYLANLSFSYKVHNMGRTYPPPKGLGDGLGGSIDKGGKKTLVTVETTVEGVLIKVEKKSISYSGDGRGGGIDKGGDR